MFNLLAAFFTVGEINIAIIDVVALVVLIIFLIVGISKGFLQQILSVLGWLAAIVVAVLFVDTVHAWVNESLPDVVTTIQGWWANIIGEQFAGVTNEETLRETLTNASIPAFLHESIVTLVGTEFGTISQTIVNTLTDWCVTAICFLVIFLAAIIVFAILKKICSAITSLPVLKQADKLLGAVLGLIEGLALLLVISVVLSMFPWFNELLYPVLETGEVVTSYFATLFDWILSFDFIQEFLAGVSAVA